MCVCLFAAADAPKICGCISDAQKDSKLWAMMNAEAASAPGAVNMNQFVANCAKVANGGLTVSPSFLFAAAAAGLALFGARARFA